MLKVNNLTLSIHNKIVLKDLTFSLKKGESLGLVGESGSGKSLTSLSLMRLLPEQAVIEKGNILFQDQNLLQLKEEEMRKLRGKSLTMIFQEPMTSLNPVFTIGYQIEEVIKAHENLSKQERQEKVLDLLNQVGIPDPKLKIKQYPHELSGGQKQRVMIAAAIACNPDLLIADEPTTALDVTIQKQVLDLLKKLQEERKMSLIFITHDLAVVSEMVDNIVVLYQGKIVEKSSTKDIFTQAQDSYTKGLLACRPEMNLGIRRLPVLSDFLTGEGPKKEPKKEKFLGETLLEIKDLTVVYDLPRKSFLEPKKTFEAVKNVSLKLRRGETLGIVGESGSGKSTLGRTLLRLLNPKSGEVFYKGQNLKNLTKKESFALRKKMQIIFQDPYSSLNPRMTVQDTLLEPMIIHDLYSKQERQDKVKELIEKVGLEQRHLNRYPHEFSGGQRQRISIARALAVEPEFIVCDESVSALDVSVQAQILNLLSDLQDDYNLSYIFISHDLSVVFFLCDHVAVMKEGEIVEYNTTAELYKKPQHPYSQSLFDAIPKVKYS